MLRYAAPTRLAGRPAARGRAGGLAERSAVCAPAGGAGRAQDAGCTPAPDAGCVETRPGPDDRAGAERVIPPDVASRRRDRGVRLHPLRRVREAYCTRSGTGACVADSGALLALVPRTLTAPRVGRRGGSAAPRLTLFQGAGSDASKRSARYSLRIEGVPGARSASSSRAWVSWQHVRTSSASSPGGPRERTRERPEYSRPATEHRGPAAPPWRTPSACGTTRNPRNPEELRGESLDGRGPLG